MPWPGDGYLDGCNRAALLYLSDVPLRQCMMLTSHTTEANFRRYIMVTKEENARLLADNPLFRD